MTWPEGSGRMAKFLNSMRSVPYGSENQNVRLFSFVRICYSINVFLEKLTEII